jgi:hypothetical protein
MKLPMAPTLAGAAGLAVAVGIALTPAWRIEAAVSASGLPAFLPAAAPPLGITARIGLMLGAGGIVTVLLWFALLLLTGQTMLSLAKPAVADEADEDELPPAVRRADAHPDAPPRPPVRATRDLGTPFLDVTAPVEVGEEVTLPRDLDTPMALFDPAALPVEPVAPAPTVRPLFRAAAPEPVVEPEPEPEVQPAAPEPPSIADLLTRLDDGLNRRADAPKAAPPATGLASTLGALRQLATRG